MSIKKDGTHFYAEYDMHCDGTGCGAVLEGCPTFNECAAARKANGWASRKIGKRWYDLCEDCQKKQVGEDFIP